MYLVICITIWYCVTWHAERRGKRGGEGEERKPHGRFPLPAPAGFGGGQAGAAHLQGASTPPACLLSIPPSSIYHLPPPSAHSPPGGVSEQAMCGDGDINLLHLILIPTAYATFASYSSLSVTVNL